MSERPILFSGPMVRAILDGRKTQTRRVMTGWNPAYLDQYCGRDKQDWQKNRAHVAAGDPKPCPYGVAGDRLWVRETWGERTYPSRMIEYAADVDLNLAHNQGCWKSPIYMPRRASRLTLNVVAVRVERLQEISDDDAKAEGVTIPVAPVSATHGTPCLRLTGPIAPTAYKPGTIEDWSIADLYRFEFASLWESINAKRGHSWDSNPWVWVIEFAPLGSESAGKE